MEYLVVLKVESWEEVAGTGSLLTKKVEGMEEPKITLDILTYSW
jgi:hypothetical protein